MSEDNYNNQQISKLNDIDVVRIRRGMYITNYNHMITEIIDNALDEFTLGYATTIAVYILDDEITVVDDGRGIPVDPCDHDPNITQLELASSDLHAGSKFNHQYDENNKLIKNKETVKTSGLNGVGLSAVNALSDYMVIKVRRNNKEYGIGYERGVKTQDFTVINDNLGSNPNDGRLTGTEVIFSPDKSLWDEEEAVLDYEYIQDRLKKIAYLNSGLKCYVNISETSEDGSIKEIAEEMYYYEDGMKSFMEELIGNSERVTNDINIIGENDEVEVNITMAYINNYDYKEEETILSFSNNSETAEHGDHVTGFKNGLTKAINDYAEANKINDKFESADILEDLVAIVNIKVTDPEYSGGQNKDKLGMLKVRRAVNEVIKDYFTKYFDENPSEAKKIIKKIQDSKKARLASMRAKETNKKIKNNTSNTFAMANKLAACNSKDPKKCEIFIVEGDSAGGSAKQARDRDFQAILPIFGKVLNVEKKKLHEAVNNPKLMMLVSALGCGIGTEFDISKCKYHKIIITSDADVDGSHIKTLWLTFIYKYLRPLIEAGYLYFSCPPLYKAVISKNDIRYIQTDEDKEKLIKQFENTNKKIDFQRFKGLGEMDAEQLWETTMNPENRILEQITIENIKKDEYMLHLCMGDETAPRKEFIMEHSFEANLDI